MYFSNPSRYIIDKESHMKKTILEKLGLKPVRKLSKRICVERVRALRKRIDSGRIPKDLKKHAVYYANWYSWMADNGGSRAKKKAA